MNFPIPSKASLFYLPSFSFYLVLSRSPPYTHLHLRSLLRLSSIHLHSPLVLVVIGVF